MGLMLLTLIKVGQRKVCVRTVDTDVVVLAIAHYNNIKPGELLIMYFIRTRSTETTTHTIHNYHGTHYNQPCPGII